MRVRITHTPTRAVDGVRVSRFEEGVVYDVPASIACVLICEGWADFVSETDAPGRRQRNRPLEPVAALDRKVK